MANHCAQRERAEHPASKGDDNPLARENHQEHEHQAAVAPEVAEGAVDASKAFGIEEVP